MQNGGNTFTLTDIITNHTVQVTFILQTFLVTPSATPIAPSVPNTPQTVYYGNNITLTATTSAGYAVNTWLVDGKVAQNGGTTFTLSDVTANHSVQVTSTPNAITSLSLSTAPLSPQPINTTITLIAASTCNGGQAQYLYRVGYVDTTDVGTGRTLPAGTPPAPRPVPGNRRPPARIRW